MILPQPLRTIADNRANQRFSQNPTNRDFLHPRYSRTVSGNCLLIGSWPMRPDKLIHPRRFRHLEAEHWRDMDKLHELLHSLPNYFKTITRELLEKPMSRQELQESMRPPLYEARAGKNTDRYNKINKILKYRG
jgi:hypothetical protein